VTTRSKPWQERQRRLAEAKPRVRLDGLHVESLGPARGYAAVIEGFNLHMAIAPPRVTVGGVLLERMQFQRDGRVIRGVLPRKPRGGRVVVDYGFARAELKVSARSPEEAT